MRYSWLRRLFNVIVIVSLLFSAFSFLFVEPAAARRHIGGLHPYGDLGFWGCVSLPGEEVCLDGAFVTISRLGNSITECTYLGDALAVGCPSATGTHDVESYPYYGIAFTSLLDDVMTFDGILTETATLTITAVYTHPTLGQPFTAGQTVTVEPGSFDVFSERRVDLALQTKDSESAGGVPVAEEWPILSNVEIGEGALRLGEGFAYSDFADVNGLILNGDATQTEGVLRLTPSEFYKTGSAWQSVPQYIRDGFETTFEFQITDMVNTGGDGFAFVIQNHLNTALGHGGGGLGYVLLPNSLAIEFDTALNAEIDDPNDNHLSVHTRGLEGNDSNHSFSLGATTDIPSLSDANVHKAMIRYEPGTLWLYLDDLAQPALTVPITLATTLNLDAGYAWIGFTAAGGGAWENHDILNWSFKRLDSGISLLNQGGSLSAEKPDVQLSPQMRDYVDYKSFTNEYTATFRLALGEYDYRPPHYPYPIVLSTSQQEGEQVDPLPTQDILNSRHKIQSPSAVTITVGNSMDSGPGSLRQALLDAGPGDAITFSSTVFPPSLPQTITLLTPLPEITQSNLIVDASNTGVILDGQHLAGGNGLRITSSGNTIRGLQIVHFPWDGIEIADGATNNTIGGDWRIGTAPRGQGNIVTLNGENGISIQGSGTTSNVVAGNLVGLDIDGTRDFRVQAMVVSPAYAQDQTVFIGSQYNGIWKTVDGGNLWSPVNDGLTALNVHILAISSAYDTDHTIFAAAENEIFKSVDGGMHWTCISSGLANDRKVLSLVLSPNYAVAQTMFVIIDDSGPYVSVDGGDTWQSLQEGLPDNYWSLQGLAISPNYAIDQTIFAYAGDRILKSSDAGVHWTTVKEGVEGIKALLLSPAYASDQTLYAGLNNCSPGIMLLSSGDGGVSWDEIQAGDLCELSALALSPDYANDQLIFWANDWGGVFTSTNGGVDWSQIKSGRFYRVLGFSPTFAQDKTLFVGQNTGELAKSVDGGLTWLPIGMDLTELGNHNYGVYIAEGAQRNIIGGADAGTRNVISNNGIEGVIIRDSGTDHNVVAGNYIGMDISGTQSLGNDTEGVLICLGAQFNRVGGSTSDERNIIGGNVYRGVGLWSGAMSNTVQGNYIGLDVSGASPVGNGASGVLVSDGAQYNQIGGTAPGERNIISGNGVEGVVLWDSGTMHNMVFGNYIGTDVNGMSVVGNYDTGILIGTGAKFNHIGGSLSSKRNLVSGNGAHGVVIYGIGAEYNLIAGNYIGTDINGTQPLGNQYFGVHIVGTAKYNQIGSDDPEGRNVISANGWDGISIYDSGTMSNVVIGNYVGTDATGTSVIGNQGRGIVIGGGAQNNQIGNGTSQGRNIISGNRDQGVGLLDMGTMSNTIAGNYIGVDISGGVALGNRCNGVYIDYSAQFNQIGGTESGSGNIIGGNGGSGVTVRGDQTTHNTIVGNHIGIDVNGTVAIGNQNSGVSLGNGAQYNVIGGSTLEERNVIGGNIWDGITFWDSTTMSNTVIGNYIGLDASGAVSLGNYCAGVAFYGGASANRVGGTIASERNIISGNNDAGVRFSGSGTTNNTVIGNYIGVNPEATIAIRNRWGVGCVDNAQYNQIENNLIAGSKYDGIRLDGCNFNNIVGNSIGTDMSGTLNFGNGQHGISLLNSAQQNLIGPNNVIAYNYARGVSVWDAGSNGNRITQNSIHQNGIVGIDNGNGGNQELLPPMLIEVTTNTVTGIASTPYATIELFSDADNQGQIYEGTVTADAGKVFSFSLSSALNGPYLTATTTDAADNTSEFAVSRQVAAPACISRLRYEELKTQALTQHPDNLEYRIGALLLLLTQEMNTSDTPIGLEWPASLDNPVVVDFDYLSIVWSDTGGNTPIPDPDGTWTPEPDFHQGGWGFFAATERLQMTSSGGAIRICADGIGESVRVSISGAVAAPVDSAYNFIANFSPLTTTSTVTYMWQVNEHPPIIHTNGVTDILTLNGEVTGVQIITVTATSTEGEALDTHTILLENDRRCLSESRYEALKPQMISQYPDDEGLRIEMLVNTLNQEWEAETDGLGLEWIASPFSAQSFFFGERSIVWTDTGWHTPVPDPAGTWITETDFLQGGRGVFEAGGQLEIFSSGRSARICSTPVISSSTIGYAISVPITPTSLLTWTFAQLTADIPYGTEMHASVLDSTLTSLPGLRDLPLSNGTTLIDLSGIDAVSYPSLRLQVFLTSTLPSVSPVLTDWKVSWLVHTHQVQGQVTDGYSHPLQDAQVVLLSDGTPVMTTTTDAAGAYTLFTTPQVGVSYAVRVYLRYGNVASPAFQIHYAAASMYAGPVVYLETPITLAPDITEIMVDFDFLAHQSTYDSNILPNKRLDDLAVLYYHTHQVVDFIKDNLGVSLRTLDVDAYANYAGYAFYNPERSAYVVGKYFSDYVNGSRPMNREWHETFHALMEDTITIPESSCVPSFNHGGWFNCSTADSWAEGWAEFWTTVLWGDLGLSDPHLYRLGNRYVSGAISFEDNWQVWDRACDAYWCPSREEFAVAALLRDLFDPVQSREDDYVNISLDRLWEIFGATTYSPLRDVKDVYDALVLANEGQTVSRSRSCGLDDLDQIFVLHGVYHDANQNRHYDCGEEVGRAAEGYSPPRSERRDAPLAEAYLNVDFQGSGLTTPITLVVETAFHDAAYLDFSYDVVVTQTHNNRVYIEPPPAARIPTTVTLSAYTGEFYGVNSLVITNAQYWHLVDTAPTTGSVVLTHTFEMASPAPTIIDVQPLALTNEMAHAITITLDPASDDTLVWLGTQRLYTVSRVAADTIQAIVSAGMEPSTYAIRVAHPGSAIAVYADTLSITYPPAAHNIVRLTHGAGEPGDDVRVYVDVDTQDAVTGLQIAIQYPSDKLTFLAPPNPAYRSQYLSSFDSSTSTGEIVLLGLGTTAEAIPPGAGPLAALTFHIAESATPGEVFPLTFGDVIFSDNRGNSLSVTGIPNEIQVCTDCFAGIRSGDANGDGAVNVLDYYRVLNIILGQNTPSNAEWYAADANGDGDVNVLDLIVIVLTILSGTGRQSSSLTRTFINKVQDAVVLSIPPIPESHGSIVAVPLLLSNTMDVAGMEVLFTYSEAMTLTDIVATSRAAQMSLDKIMGVPGTAGFVLSSLSGKTIAPGDGAVVELVFETIPDANLETPRLLEAIAGDAQGQSLAVHWFDFSLSSEKTLSAYPGNVVYYSHTLTNTSSITDTLTLSATSSAGWTVSLVGGDYPGGTATLPLRLGSGQATMFTLTVDVPGNAQPNITATTFVTATSIGDPTVSRSVQDVTFVESADYHIYLPVVLRSQQ